MARILTETKKGVNDMPEKQPNNTQSPAKKPNNVKINRSAVVTAILLVAALAVIIAITVATNRAKKTEEPPTVTKSPTAATTAPTVTTEPPAPEQTKKPESTTGSAQVEDKLPSFILPVNGILSKSHDATLQVYSNTMKDYRVHLGVDIVTEENAPVYAAADGVVSQIYEDVRMGYCISIKHSDDTYTVYSNLGKEPADGIEAGVSVKAGQLIGCVGNSAMVEIAEDPHLHLEMTVDGKHVNPLDYFDQTTIASLNIDTKYEG